LRGGSLCLIGVLISGCGPLGSRSEGDESASAGSGSSAAGTTGGSAAATSGGTSAGGATETGSGGTSSSGATSAGGASAGGMAGVGAPNEFCAGLTFEEDVTIAASQTDRFAWNDSDCQPRTASLARTVRGYVRQYTYMYDGTERTATGTGVNGHDGWGFAVNHGLSGLSGGGPLGSGHFKSIFVGAHHAIYEYQLTHEGVLVTLHWLFASGRNHPLLAINYDLTGTSPGLDGDSRTPYGDIAWDGDENLGSTVISGIGWGDRYKFKTTTAPLTRNSAWDYSEPNLVPYVLEWADASDSEMGAVQSQTYLQKDAGGYWFYKNWGKTSANQQPDDGQVGLMPASWNWPYQMNQYELCYPETMDCVDQPTNSHRLAWGANYGAVGGHDSSGMYPSYGDDKQLVGYPYHSYSVFMVMGKHSSEAVLNQVREIEAVQKTTLTAAIGSVVSELPIGIGRPDTAALEPAGYDARYSTWNLVADGDRVDFSFDVAEGALRNPLLVVASFSGAKAPGVSLDGTALVPDVDYLASVDTATQKLWITLRATLQGEHQITIE
jgi:hypothetical protein